MYYIVKKFNLRLHCLRKLNQFNVNPNMLSLFYNAFIRGVWTNCFEFLGGNLAVTDKARINSIIKRAGAV